MAQNYDDLFDSLGQKYNVDPRLIKTVYQLESSQGINTGRSLPNDPDSPIGPFQERPTTAEATIPGSDPNDTAQAAEVAAKYLRHGLDLTGNEKGALGFYYSGSSNPAAWGPNTQAYMNKGDGVYASISLNLGASTPQPSAGPSDSSLSQADKLMQNPDSTDNPTPSGPADKSMSTASTLMQMPDAAPGPSPQSLQQADQLLQSANTPVTAAPVAPIQGNQPPVSPQLQPGQNLAPTPAVTPPQPGQDVNAVPVNTAVLSPASAAPVNALNPGYQSPIQQLNTAQASSDIPAGNQGPPPNSLAAAMRPNGPTNGPVLQQVGNQAAGVGYGLLHSTDAPAELAAKGWTAIGGENIAPSLGYDAVHSADVASQKQFNADHPNTQIAQGIGSNVGEAAQDVALGKLGSMALGKAGIAFGAGAAPAATLGGRAVQAVANFASGNGGLASAAINAEVLNGINNTLQSANSNKPFLDQLTQNWLSAPIMGTALRTAGVALMPIIKTNLMDKLTDPNGGIPNASAIITRLSADQQTLTNKAINAIQNPSLKDKIQTALSTGNLARVAVRIGASAVAAHLGYTDIVDHIAAQYIGGKIGNAILPAIKPTDINQVKQAIENQIWNVKNPLIPYNVLNAALTARLSNVATGQQNPLTQSPPPNKLNAAQPSAPAGP